MCAFIESKPLGEKQLEQLKPLIDLGVHLEELIIDDTPKGLHYIFASFQGKTQHFYISDNSNDNNTHFVNKSILKSVKSS